MSDSHKVGKFLTHVDVGKGVGWFDQCMSRIGLVRQVVFRILHDSEGREQKSGAQQDTGEKVGNTVALFG
jgi:hypothetical protein